MNVLHHIRRFRRYRAMVRELGGYSHGELTELGIAPADIDRIAREAVFGQRSS